MLDSLLNEFLVWFKSLNAIDLFFLVFSISITYYIAYKKHRTISKDAIDYKNEEIKSLSEISNYKNLLDDSKNNWDKIIHDIEKFSVNLKDFNAKINFINAKSDLENELTKKVIHELTIMHHSVTNFLRSICLLNNTSTHFIVEYTALKHNEYDQLQLLDDVGKYMDIFKSMDEKLYEFWVDMTLLFDENEISINDFLKEYSKIIKKYNQTNTLPDMNLVNEILAKNISLMKKEKEILNSWKLKHPDV